MTIATTTNHAVFSGNGAATSFDFTFKAFDADHIKVWKIAADGAQTDVTASATVTLDGDDGGEVVYPNSGGPLASGEQLFVERIVPLDQDFQFVNQGPFFAKNHEDAFDTRAMIDQQVSAALARTLTVPRGNSGVEISPEAAANLNELDDLDVVADAGAVVTVRGGAPSDADTLKKLNDKKADKATTLSEYGITDAYTEGEADALLAEKANLTGGNTFQGLIIFQTNAPKTNVPPTVSTDLTNKTYVDNVFGRGARAAVATSEISALSTAALSDGDTVLLVANGRSGSFTWQVGDQSANISADPQKGCWIAPSSDATGASGAWVRLDYLNGAELNAKWFGALGDDASDDTATMQAAIDFAQYSNRKLRVPAGIYRVADLTPRDGMHIIGDGISWKDDGGTTFRALAASTDIFKYVSTTTFIYNICLQDLALRGAGGVAGCRGFSSYSNQVYVVNARFLNVEFFLDLKFGTFGNFIFSLWEDCRFGTSGAGVAGDPNYAIRILGILGSTAPAGGANDNQIVRCKFNLDYYQHILATRCKRLLISDTDHEALDGPNALPIMRFEGCRNVTVQRPWFERCSHPHLIELREHVEGGDTQNCVNFLLTGAEIQLEPTNTHIIHTDNLLQVSSIQHSTFINVPAASCSLTNGAVGFNYENDVLSGGPFADEGRLDDITGGSVVMTGVGFTGTAPTFTLDLKRSADVIAFTISQNSGTSNSTSFTLESPPIPAPLRPRSTRYVPIRIRDNGVDAFGLAEFAADGTVRVRPDAAQSAWTATGEKGIRACSGSYAR